MNEPMRPPRRRFTLIDAMIMVAATAAGLVAPMPENFADYLNFALAVPLAWGPAILGLALARPAERRDLRRGAPGLLACLAEAVTAVFIAARLACDVLIMPPLNKDWYIRHIPVLVCVETAYYSGAAVAATWLTLIATRRWRPSPSWADRLGRLFGVYWMVAVLVYDPVLKLLHRLR